MTWTCFFMPSIWPIRSAFMPASLVAGWALSPTVNTSAVSLFIGYLTVGYLIPNWSRYVAYLDGS